VTNSLSKPLVDMPSKQEDKVTPASPTRTMINTRKEPVSTGLNLQLELKDPSQLPALMLAINSQKERTNAALQALHFVHFARFLPTRDHRVLQVITSFDGPIQAYVLDFVIAIGEVFNTILSFVKDAPPLPVSEYPAAFLEFVQNNNRVVVQEPLMAWDNYPTYCAYPATTVVDILGPSDQPPVVRQVQPATVNRADVQGQILAGYRVHCARHYGLRIHCGSKTRALLRLLVDGHGDDLPRITSGEIWQEKPNCMLNLGLTAPGLRALGVKQEHLNTLPRVFLEGPGHPERARANGDTGASSPELWEMGGARSEVHLMLSLYASSPESQSVFDRRHSQLLAAFEAHGLELVHQHDAQALPNNQVHFGYRDSISQPRLALTPENGVATEKPSDGLPLSSVGEFLLGRGYTSVYGGSSLGQMHGDLCENATFAVVRAIDQDVAAFEKLLTDVAQMHGVDREWVAAKLMGRWRDGTPLSALSDSPNGLAQSKETDGIENPPGQASTSNAFDFAPSLATPLAPNDHTGAVCPVGAHIRRMNPRSARVAGQPYSRRIIRRGLPYGPAWDPANASARRGLFALFICADIERQFEFMVQQWANGDSAASGIKGMQDPIFGSQDLSAHFEIPRPNGQTPVTFQVPRWCTTRSSLYLLMPGISGLRWLSQGMGFDEDTANHMGPALWLSTPPAVRKGAKLAPAQLDPLDPDFLRNPYPYYALFRQHAPVSKVQRGNYEAYWIFGHGLCQEAALDSNLFLKKPADQAHAGRGMFNMDAPEHGPVRAAINPAFAQAMVGVKNDVQERALHALERMRSLRTPDQCQHIDLMTDFANPIFSQTFMRMFGLPQSQWATVSTLANTMLKCFCPMGPADQIRQSKEAAMGISVLLTNLAAAHCPMHQRAAHDTSWPQTAPALFQRIVSLAAANETLGLSMNEAIPTGLNLILGGYLSSAFLLGTGLYHLQQQTGVWQAFIHGGAALRLNAWEEIKRFDPPFQLADRYAARDVVLCGVRIPKDARVCLVLGSANRDATVFGHDAEHFDIERAPQAEKNLVFGWGEHQCMGMPMAQVTVPTVLNALADHCESLTLLPEMARWGQDPYFRTFETLPAQLRF
jgi:cytochrome P450/deferrochelatase/peroxidase EfeB